MSNQKKPTEETEVIAVYKARYTKIGIGLLVALAVSIILRMTPAINSYSINLATAIVIENWFWIILISVLLFIANILEKLKFKEKQEQEKRNVH
ncbi:MULTISPECIES: hypothetical protein [Erysipelotrichaceae]|uniref:hypothetical protein n=1 Tax=Erysipelotrichaceae TaxID=128827 RepID=UPI00259BB267|nr:MULTISPECIES: hypothetical protein [Erysipelotrichaceae]